MLKLFSEKKRWAVIKGVGVNKSIELKISRSRQDGSTISVGLPPTFGGTKWLTIDTSELMLAVMHVTHTEEQLREKLNV